MKIALLCSDDHLAVEAEGLAQRLQLPLVSVAEDFDFLLEVQASGIGLVQTGPKAPGAVRVDFDSGAVAHRRKFGGGMGQQIVKACGVSSSFKPYIADLTAGLGRDSFVLATVGCRVQMVERSPIVHTLLEDGLRRASSTDDSELAEIIARMSLQAGQATDFLSTTSEKFDVIYLDPMFPHTDKSAQVKKEMLAFRSVVGADEDSASLLEAALAADPSRIVVKRPRKAPVIEGPKPSYSLEGKSGRFDIYAKRKLG